LVDASSISRHEEFGIEESLGLIDGAPRNKHLEQSLQTDKRATLAEYHGSEVQVQ
jgi:hypothetical protein